MAEWSTPCTGVSRPHRRAPGAGQGARRASRWRRSSCARRPPWRSSRSIRPSRSTSRPEDLHDFQRISRSGHRADIMAANGPTILTRGQHALWRGLAAIVVVWTGIKIAMSGTFSMWTIIELVIGLWIPWVMLVFYATPIPGVGFTFPGMIAGGGNWLHSFFPVGHRDGCADRAVQPRPKSKPPPCPMRGPVRAIGWSSDHRPRLRPQHAGNRHVDDACSFFCVWSSSTPSPMPRSSGRKWRS